MTDCPNAAVRDLLPDLLHGRLELASRAMVQAHVESCADCQEELALLRNLLGARRGAPQVDLAAIVAALPAYRVPVARSWVGWRTAAAITLLVAGGSSVMVLQHKVSPVTDTLTLAPSVATESKSVPAVVAAPVTVRPSIAPSVAVVAPLAPPVAADATPAKAGRELALSGGPLNELSDRELALLLKEIESLDAVPSTEVENNAISPIAPARSRP